MPAAYSAQPLQSQLSEGIEALSEGLAIYGADERMVFCNRAYRDSLPRLAALGILRPGVSFCEILRAGITHDFVPPAYRNEDDFFEKRLHRFRNPVGRYEYASTDGKWFRCEERRTSNGGTVSIRAEITARKRVELSLEASEESFRNLTEDSLQGVSIISPARKPLNVNRAYAEIFGYESAEAVLALESTAILVAPHDRERLAVYRQERLQGNDVPTHYEYEGVRKDGEIVHLQAISRSTNWQGEKAVQVTLLDITERRKAKARQRELEESLRQAQKMEMVGQLTGGIAHDFNNLLGIIVGNLDFLEEELRDRPDLPALLAPAMQAALGGASLNRQLLSFARQQPLSPGPVDLNDNIAAMLGMLRRTLGNATEIRIEPADGLWPTNVDKHYLESALLNLAINARDAMPDGGRLTLTTANLCRDANDPAANPDLTPGDYVLLAVSDTGAGMAEETGDRAFEPFFTTKDVGQGSGLGLSMVFGFVKQSGGHVTIRSAVGQGTTVTLYLPRGIHQSSRSDGYNHVVAARPETAGNRQ
ncbi:MAG: PAS domain S-box protein [Proteobacteria bacterium]|nr:PAS domain S-box protein [Pseudomonadota bacterium]